MSTYTCMSASAPLDGVQHPPAAMGLSLSWRKAWPTNTQTVWLTRVHPDAPRWQYATAIMAALPIDITSSLPTPTSNRVLPPRFGQIQSADFLTRPCQRDCSGHINPLPYQLFTIRFAASFCVSGSLRDDSPDELLLFKQAIGVALTTLHTRAQTTLRTRQRTADHSNERYDRECAGLSAVAMGNYRTVQDELDSQASPDRASHPQILVELARRNGFDAHALL